MHASSLSVAALLLVLFSSLSHPANALSIVRLALVNVLTKAAIPLPKVINVTYPYAIAAVLDDSTPPQDTSIQFILPLPLRIATAKRKAPYTIPDTFASGKLRRLSLSPGTHTFRVQLNDDESTRFDAETTIIDSSFLTVPPSSLFKELRTPPTVAPACRSLPAPVFGPIQVFNEFAGPYNGDFSYYPSVLFPCEKRHAIRFRLAKIMSSNSSRVVFSRKREVDAGKDPSEPIRQAMFFTSRSCNDRPAIASACFKGPVGKEVCSYSPVFSLLRREQPEPILKFRPPILLEVAPGDSVRVRFKLDRASDAGKSSPFANGGVNFVVDKLKMKTRVVTAGGRRVSTSRFVSSHLVDRTLPIASKRISKFLDGAYINMMYATADCKSTFVNYGERWATKLVVRDAISSLVTQDVRLPKIDVPLKYPKTPIGTPVTLSVKARNIGGGKRADGSSPKLHYQWYLRRFTDFLEPTYAEPIMGETSSTLTIPKAQCECVYCPSAPGCDGLLKYYVDVCNTYGCQRSGPVSPDIIPRRDASGKIVEDCECF